MSNFIFENNLLSEHQAGFRKGYSIQTAALRVYDDLVSTVDKKGSAVLLLLDFSKAFDTIPHNKLCSKLQTKFNFAVSAVNLIDSYLNGRNQTVFCGIQQSKSGNITSGVPQGSVLGPLLFCCHINDLPDVLKYCSIQMYADDIQLYVKGRGSCDRDLIMMANDDLKRIVEWNRGNQLFINHTKSKALLVRRTHGRSLDLLPSIIIEGQTVEWTDAAKNLGFWFQADLKWNGLINQQCGKIYSSLRTLYGCAKLASFSIRMKLFKTLILPHFLFGDILHVNPSSSAMGKLRVALNCCIRFVYKLDRYAHVSHLQINLIGCPLENLYAYRSCLFLHKLMNTHHPPDLFQKLTPFQGRRLQKFIIPSNNSIVYSNSFFVRGVIHWNSLPSTLKQTVPETIFKRGCLEYWNRN